MSKDLFALNQTPIGKKPIGNYEIDWNNPLARGLIGAYIVDNSTGKLIDITGKASNATINNALIETSEHGQIVSFDGVDDNLDIDADIFDTDQISITMLARNRDAGAFKRVIATPLHYTNLYVVSIGDTSNFVTIEGNVDNQQYAAGFTYSNYNEWTSFTAIPFDRKILSGGVVHDTTDPVNAGYGFFAGNFRVAERQDGSSDWAGDIKYLYFHDRKLTLDEATRLHADPYQFLKPASIQESVYAALQSALSPIAVDDYYTATSGTQLVVPAVTGILLNDTYTA